MLRRLGSFFCRNWSWFFIFNTYITATFVKFANVKKSVAKILQAAHQASAPRNVAPMSLTLFQEPFSHKDWQVEIKWDGFRIIAHLNRGKVELKSKSNNNWTENLPPAIWVSRKMKKARQSTICGLWTSLNIVSSGERGIRTPGPFGSTVFKTAAFDRSAISPAQKYVLSVCQKNYREK